LFLMILVSAAGLHAAPRKYVFGTTIDFMAGGRTPPVGLIQRQEFNPFYAVYPSLQLNSKGEHSVLQMSYAFGYDRLASNPPWIARSQVAGSTLSVTAGPRWKLNLSESFNRTADFTAFNAVRGVTAPSEGFSFPFYPVSSQLSTKTNDAGVSAEY